MALVGPRPHPTELNRRYVPLIESYSARHCIAPGITGWAQVNGYRGETRTVAQMQRRVELDLEYIRDHSVAFDLWILLRTVASVLLHRDGSGCGVRFLRQTAGPGAAFGSETPATQIAAMNAGRGYLETKGIALIWIGETGSNLTKPADQT